MWSFGLTSAADLMSARRTFGVVTPRDVSRASENYPGPAHRQALRFRVRTKTEASDKTEQVSLVPLAPQSFGD